MTAGEDASKGGGRPLLRLRSLGGKPAPDGFFDEAQRVSQLTKPALDSLWYVLEPCLADSVTPEIERQLSAYCQRYEIAEADLSHVIRIARFLLRSAASISLDAASFKEDLAAAWPGSDHLHEVLMDGYEPVTQELRRRLLADALQKHGHVLQSIEWRVDRVVADTSAPRLGMPVAIITLTHSYRDQSGSLTLQLTPDQLTRAAQVFSSLALHTEQLQNDGSLPEVSAPAAGQAEL